MDTVLTYSDDTSSVIYGLLVAIDCMVLPFVFVGTLLTMLQDRLDERRGIGKTVKFPPAISIQYRSVINR